MDFGHPLMPAPILPGAPAPLQKEAEAINQEVTRLQQERVELTALAKENNEVYERCTSTDRRGFFARMVEYWKLEATIRERVGPVLRAVAIVRSQAYQEVRGRLDEIEAKLRRKLDWPEDKGLPREVLLNAPGWARLRAELAGMSQGDGDSQENDHAMHFSQSQAVRFAAMLKQEEKLQARLAAEAAAREKRAAEQTAAAEAREASRREELARLLV